MLSERCQEVSGRFQRLDVASGVRKGSQDASGILKRVPEGLRGVLGGLISHVA